MEQADHASLWVGTAPTSNELEKYLEIKSTRDGDSVPSPFMKAFKIAHYNEDFREAHRYRRSTRSLKDLLEGFSYDDMLIPAFTQQIGELVPVEANAVILLFNFAYDGRVKEATDEKISFVYIGSVRYES